MASEFRETLAWTREQYEDLETLRRLMQADGLAPNSKSAIVRWGLARAAKGYPAAAVIEAPKPTAAQRLKSAREAAGLSSGALGRLLGYTDHSAISQQERGRAPLSAVVLAWLTEQGR